MGSANCLGAESWESWEAWYGDFEAVYRAQFTGYIFSFPESQMGVAR